MMVTSVTWPRSTSPRKSENASCACGPRLDEFWNRLNSATSSSPMMIHTARFFPKFFTILRLSPQHPPPPPSTPPPMDINALDLGSADHPLSADIVPIGLGQSTRSGQRHGRVRQDRQS